MMNDLISREQVLKKIKGMKAQTRAFGQITYATGYSSALSTLEGVLADMPTVDAVPVVHGRCVVCERGNERCATCKYFFDYNDDGGYDKCSSSCDEVKCNQYRPVNYCPNCGAKMDGDNDALD